MWEAENGRDYNWAAPARSCVTAVSRQQLAEEAKPVGTHSVLSLLDLKKAYELIKHWYIVSGAVALKFPLAILRLMLACFSAVRVLTVGDLYSETIVVAGASILAGSVFGPIANQMTGEPQSCSGCLWMIC